MATKRSSAKTAPKQRQQQPPPNPWDRIDGEPDKAFEAFRIYLELGAGRTSEKVRERTGHRSVRQIERWSSKWQWRRRVAAFDQQAAATADEAHLDQVAKRSRAQAELMALHGRVMALPAQEIEHRLDGGQPKHFKSSSLEDLFRMAALGARAGARVVPVERLAEGVSTDAPAAPAYTPAQERARQASDEELDAELAGVDPAVVVPINRGRK